jgi:hypothetical protein
VLLSKVGPPQHLHWPSPQEAQVRCRCRFMTQMTMHGAQRKGLPGTLNGCWVLLQGSVGQVYYIGTRKERTVLGIVLDICKLFGLSTGRIVHIREGGPCRRSYVSDDRLSQLGWKERTPWEEGLRKTVEWYLSISPADHWKKMCSLPSWGLERAQ